MTTMLVSAILVRACAYVLACMLLCFWLLEFSHFVRMYVRTYVCIGLSLSIWWCLLVKCTPYTADSDTFVSG